MRTAPIAYRLTTDEYTLCKITAAAFPLAPLTASNVAQSQAGSKSHQLAQVCLTGTGGACNESTPMYKAKAHAHALTSCMPAMRAGSVATSGPDDLRAEQAASLCQGLLANRPPARHICI